MTSLLVTNDFPPKTGGIQSYLWELWRRLPPEHARVLTTPWPDAGAFDADQPFPVVRARAKVLLPTPRVVRWIRGQAAAAGADLVVLDPALPLGLLGPRLGLPYAIVVHGAELTVPARLPGARAVLAPVLARARLVVAAGGYPAGEVDRVTGGSVPVVVVPPGVDTDAFRPLDDAERKTARADLGLPADARIVLSMSRLVPRKGMDVLIAAAALLAPTRPDLLVVIAGAGRDRPRLERLARHCRAPVRFLGWVSDADKPRLLAGADVFAMLCRSRWGGLEQEGFGIVFLEAAACGVAQVAGRSGGSAEAVVDGETGEVVARPHDPVDAAAAIARLLDDDDRRRRQGVAARAQAEATFSYDRLAATLAQALTAAAATATATAPGR
ncbi:MAG: phosphatidyl-myo-inositol dimannoside synthase [Actinomycetota bacterium]|nr:phosphatidyl-myo-inositol dimannoside synthase [Actinomycetota bacterium]